MSHLFHAGACYARYTRCIASQPCARLVGGVAHVAEAVHATFAVHIQGEQAVPLEVLRTAQPQAQVWLELRDGR